MNEAKRKYQKNCKSKVITFYLHEQDLLEYANSINFQKCVKKWLRLCMTMDEINKRTTEAIKKDITERIYNDAD